MTDYKIEMCINSLEQAVSKYTELKGRNPPTTQEERVEVEVEIYRAARALNSRWVEMEAWYMGSLIEPVDIERRKLVLGVLCKTRDILTVAVERRSYKSIQRYIGEFEDFCARYNLAYT
ncbi:MAG: hypothetical protein A3G52_00945 [Candidatus Taylorbacteria bacterium RIFCSPLOWO2_12_FULL_43_20]|uniref:Uncharacterized protein n=1 Tax=Candidatus Taylorbacteria bacterium RIFCSPLOWO2_12_FULL_43_20 TaxID=1802332 RepID=A0A1G2P1N5_9BACT|nr:MAG: hypothetical protein A2825_01880 [Candidatus Taylorbacteria bacterium RIFCSPHIGHO2_01_FULL_43_120]OHA23724.1 MAG: hypothetical protein A3B98_00795 [Candidatus Taylorbacteria bacterium RIFCSPHIGHO2_02_FULL_43_55]OHA27977.1 MAG: hypothetical protein A3E92_03110 [Candidatus Taylorbacteria bacterium RIFCSPHIGHO2_12_FULL_42_34]OHA31873.1 MAG: hypothetical protein A3B09_02995 [Candidatus Taylorbacteria bacterium RIFCSPLOWO2_01_FULL_43_83]OHA39822.1 MAG: hypothetical protein A3H58_03765 [Candi